MLLVIPSIELQGGKVRRGSQSTPGPLDPVDSAKLWRKENAKALYVCDVDAALDGGTANSEIIGRMVKAVDIPILLGGGIRTFADARRAFDLGIYRVVISTMLMDNVEDALKTLELFTATKVVVGLDARTGPEGRLTALEQAAHAKRLGFKRLMYTDVTPNGDTTSPNIAAIKEFALAVGGMKITAAGGLSGFEDLMKLQDLEPLGVDSVVIGRALYENRFPCQAIWRVCEAGEYPYTARV